QVFESPLFRGGGKGFAQGSGHNLPLGLIGGTGQVAKAADQARRDASDVKNGLGFCRRFSLGHPRLDYTPTEHTFGIAYWCAEGYSYLRKGSNGTNAKGGGWTDERAGRARAVRVRRGDGSGPERIRGAAGRRLSGAGAG